MDLTEEFAGYYQIHRSEDTILVEKRPSKFLLQATGVVSCEYLFKVLVFNTSISIAR